MKTIQEVLDHYTISVHNQDVYEFMKLYDEHIHIFDSWSTWEVKSKSDWQTNIESWFNGLKRDQSNLNVKFEDCEVYEDSCIAFIHTSIRFSEYNANNIEFRHLTNRFTFGLRKTNDEWKIVHEHSSLPINPDTGNGLFNLK